MENLATLRPGEMRVQKPKRLDVPVSGCDAEMNRAMSSDIARRLSSHRSPNSVLEGASPSLGADSDRPNGKRTYVNEDSRLNYSQLRPARSIEMKSGALQRPSCPRGSSSDPMENIVATWKRRVRAVITVVDNGELERLMFTVKGARSLLKALREQDLNSP